MDEILTFRIGIEGLENKIWREIEIPCRRTVTDLAYTILASFNSLAYHLYDIEYKEYVKVKKDTFDSMNNVIKETKKAMEFQPKLEKLFNEVEELQKVIIP